MLRRASVQDVKQGAVTRGNTLVLVVMRFYPRFLRKELVDAYYRELAPPGELFAEFKATSRAGAWCRTASRAGCAARGRLRLGRTCK